MNIKELKLRLLLMYFSKKVNIMNNIRKREKICENDMNRHFIGKENLSDQSTGLLANEIFLIVSVLSN